MAKFKLGDKVAFVGITFSSNRFIEAVFVSSAISRTSGKNLLKRLNGKSMATEYDEDAMIAVNKGKLKLPRGKYDYVDVEKLDITSLDCSKISINEGLVLSDNTRLTQVKWPSRVNTVFVENTKITDFTGLVTKDFVCKNDNLGKSCPRVSREFSIAEENAELLWAVPSGCKFLTVMGDGSISVELTSNTVFRAKLSIVQSGYKQHAKLGG